MWAHHDVGVLPDGTILVKSRMVQDYGELNDNTERLHLNDGILFEDLLNTLSGKDYKYLNYSDIAKFFFQIALEPGSELYAAISTEKRILIVN